MRCNFCGFDNPQGKDKCEKCNKPLVEAQREHVNNPIVPPSSTEQDKQTRIHADNSFNPKATVRENIIGAWDANGQSTPCPKCGYELEDGSCSSCGYQEGSESNTPSNNELSDVRKTVRPIRKGEKVGVFTLTPISEENGEPEGEPLTYEGNEIHLNRENTNPKNKTITSIEQARICLDNNQWSIEDKSDYQTSFVQASRKIELQKGDLILLGNQLYRFDC